MTFDSGDVATEAIGHVSGQVEDGRFVSVIGPSGCGKSTLLDIVGGLQRPTRGQVEIGGEVVTGPRRDTAMVFQEDSTLHWRTVTENVTFGLEVAGVGGDEQERRAREMVELVGLSGFEDHRPRQLSGGMKQRVAIARALALEPLMLLMDEPFGSLDAQTRSRLQRELNEIAERTGVTVLFVTHSIQEAMVLGHRIVVLGHPPSQVEEIVDVRGLDLESEEFIRVRRHLRELLAGDEEEVDHAVFE